MHDSVREFVSRVRSRRGWDEDSYPAGTEKQLYAQFAHILLTEPTVMIPAFLALFGTSNGSEVSPRMGAWRAYRVSTVRRDRGTRWQSPYILPGCAGSGGIADVALILNPQFEPPREQVGADLILYFELKSRDHHPQKEAQLLSHLRALESDPAANNAYLGAVGGRPAQIGHPRWLGHTSLASFLRMAAIEAVGRLGNVALAQEIEALFRAICTPAGSAGSAV